MYGGQADHKVTNVTEADLSHLTTIFSLFGW